MSSIIYNNNPTINNICIISTNNSYNTIDINIDTINIAINSCTNNISNTNTSKTSIIITNTSTTC